jgi:hypothetical protein
MYCCVLEDCLVQNSFTPSSFLLTAVMSTANSHDSHFIKRPTEQICLQGISLLICIQFSAGNLTIVLLLSPSRQIFGQHLKMTVTASLRIVSSSLLYSVRRFTDHILPTMARHTGARGSTNIDILFWGPRIQSRRLWIWPTTRDNVYFRSPLHLTLYHMCLRPLPNTRVENPNIKAWGHQENW